MPPRNKWMVSELVDPREPTLPRYVIAHRQGESPWLAVWHHRNRLQNKLAAFMRTLSDEGVEPLARPLLGSGVALDENTAHGVCRFRIGEIARMAGCTPGEIPEFLCHETVSHGGRGHGRRCSVVDGDGVQTFDSIADAARFFGVARQTASRGIRQNRQNGGGAVTV